jgi:predicted nucleotidyltransferase component of viral defense system
MKEFLATLVQSAPSPVAGRNLAREYLQALLLQSLQRAGAMTMLAFHGGTALRFLYSLPRYSEDLDFALERETDSYDFRSYLHAIRKDLETQGYSTVYKINDQKTVHSGFVRFPGLPYELGLTVHQDEILAVKIEVDTNPPKGAKLDTTLVRRHVMLNLQHHDKASLLAGKLHAILQRPYLKGRDVYDLIWYLSDKDWPAPNLNMLNHALAQTGRTGASLTSENWRRIVQAQIESVSWEHVLDDVLPFLQTQQETDLLTKENLVNLLDSR